jgi:hypothetical protein
MNLYQLLEEEHSKKQCDRIVKYIGRDKERFAGLAQLFLKGEYRITQRAAWPLSYCVRAHPELIGPYFKRLLDNLGKDAIHVAVIRNTLRLRYPYCRQGLFSYRTGTSQLGLSRDPSGIKADH